MRVSSEATDCEFSLVSQMFALIEAPSWRRVWTLQEALLAARSVSHIGGRIVSLSTVVKSIDNLIQYYEEQNCCYVEVPSNQLLTKIWVRVRSPQSRQGLSQRIADKPADVNFVDLKKHDHHREAKNELDHIFGLLGLIRASSSMGDYSLTASEVYQKSVLYDIRQAGTLDILSQVIVPYGQPSQDSSI